VAAHAKKTKPRKAGDTEVVELIVRRGALRRFDRLRQSTADLPVKLTWDRRLKDRRRSTQDVTPDNRRTERRRKPPFTWETADFLVVENETGTKAPTARSATKSSSAAQDGRTAGQRGRKSDT
jgi:hypothetical protein